MLLWDRSSHYDALLVGPAGRVGALDGSWATSFDVDPELESDVE